MKDKPSAFPAAAVAASRSETHCLRLAGPSKPKMYMPKLGRLVALRFESVAHVPVLFDGQGRYCREHNRYLRERAIGEWSPKAGSTPLAGGEVPAQRTIETVARHLLVFIEWCEAKAQDWRTLTYKDGVLSFQCDMHKGRWSPSGKALQGSTANHRTDEVTSFLKWAAHNKLRPPFTVAYRASTRRIRSGQSAQESSVELNSRVGRIKTSKSASVAIVAQLPKPEAVRDWLAAVRAKRGYAKHMACRFILESGARREETVSLNQGQIPSMEELRALKSDGRQAGAVTLTHTKGGRPRTIQVNIDFLIELREWIDGRRMKLRMLWTKRTRTPASHLLFLSDARDHEGTPISAETLYKCFRDVKPRPPRWHPHFGRHTYACFTVLYTLEHEAKAAGRTMSADWVMMRGSWCMKTLQQQLGHLSETTTDLYLRWLVTAAGIAEVAQGWHEFLAGKTKSGAAS
ncbi:tyrosine-type recombinase/integrase [Microvirga sp. 3-52]|uniref:tyrosine-type recombinase/integrase n=1 Tax=Microvirga sp. 3-52 TaxID=2792425 RepID=UPI001ACFAE01|nr:tyrosine-type recombinase/integrase [Microvirga sp. 3-52]MBO1905302.1 tyrosine-type recombinase/integrase [Microvirga sp. 3-52]MBS7452609.1 tyrosine-type recombinase/integrase [Microvirga sp. 3-52]